MIQEYQKPFGIAMQQIQQSLLQNEQFIMQLKTKLLSVPSLSESHKIIEQEEIRERQFVNMKSINKEDIDFMIQEISVILNDLIDQKLQFEMNEIIEENNNVLLQIKQNLTFQQKQNSSILGNSKNVYEQSQRSDISFSDIHRLMAQQKKRFELQTDNVSDANLQKSISCLVEFKFESIEEKVLSVDKRLKTMEDKYETNLKSIWNVLSMTEGAVFDFITKEKQKEKLQAESQGKQKLNHEKAKKSQALERKSGFFKLW